MKTSEKVLLVAAGAVCIWGGYELLGSRRGLAGGGQDSQGTRLDQLTADLASLRTQIATAKLPEATSHVFEAARAEWGPDPFLDRKLPSEIAEERRLAEAATRAAKDQATEEAAEPHFAYTGFMALGDKRLAVLDSVEYEVGQELASGEYLVKSIEPGQVVLKPRHGAREIVVERQDEN